VKNNNLAMLGTISLAVAWASLIGYIDPATCTIEGAQGVSSCREIAAQHITVFWVFAIFGVVTLSGAFFRKRIARAYARLSARRG
jgi:ABC-type multidrug transport system permease subunit